MLQTKLVGSIKPQNKLCINLEVPISYYFQYKWPYRSCLFHLIPARYDHNHRFNGFFLPLPLTIHVQFKRNSLRVIHLPYTRERCYIIINALSKTKPLNLISPSFRAVYKDPPQWFSRLYFKNFTIHIREFHYFRIVLTRKPFKLGG